MWAQEGKPDTGEGEAWRGKENRKTKSKKEEEKRKKKRSGKREKRKKKGGKQTIQRALNPARKQL
jgi:hypothetical protein